MKPNEIAVDDAAQFSNVGIGHNRCDPILSKDAYLVLKERAQYCADPSFHRFRDVQNPDALGLASYGTLHRPNVLEGGRVRACCVHWRPSPARWHAGLRLATCTSGFQCRVVVLRVSTPEIGGDA
jgi:hypothetical protein